MGFDVKTFHAIIATGFGDTWKTLPIPHVGGMLRRRKKSGAEVKPMMRPDAT
jgi:hypothetical protein